MDGDLAPSQLRNLEDKRLTAVLRRIARRVLMLDQELALIDDELEQLVSELFPDLLDEFGVDIWLFTNELWLTRNGDGEYVPHEKRAIQADPTIIKDFTPYLSVACKIVGASSDAALLQRCEAAIKKAVGTQATAVQSQSYYLDVTPPGCDKGTFVQAMAKRQGISTDAVATIGDMQNDLAMFKTSGLSIAMGNATDDVKKLATHVTTSNEDEGFAGAIEMILKSNAGG